MLYFPLDLTFSQHDLLLPQCTLLQSSSLTLKCLVVTKGHTYFNKLAAFSCRFALVCITFYYHQALKGWDSTLQEWYMILYFYVLVFSENYMKILSRHYSLFKNWKQFPCSLYLHNLRIQVFHNYYFMKCVARFGTIFKKVKNTHGGVILTLLKVTLLHGCFSRFINSTNDTKSHYASHIFIEIFRNPDAINKNISQAFWDSVVNQYFFSFLIFFTRHNSHLWSGWTHFHSYFAISGSIRIGGNILINQIYNEKWNIN